MKSLDNKYIQANGRDTNITNNNVGSIRLIRLIKKNLNENEPFVTNSFKIIDVIKYPEMTKNISTPMKPPLKG